MAKKSNVNIPAIAVIRLIVFLFIGFILFLGYTRSVEFLTTSPLFAVREVMIDSSIQFMDVSELRRLKGRNIFRIDLVKLQNRIKSQYPQIKDLRVMRELPDRIKVLAKKRDPFFQLILKSKILLVDSQGVPMYYVSKPLDLPVVTGIGHVRVAAGTELNDPAIPMALQVLREFRSHPHTARLKIAFIDLNNPAKIDVALSEGLHVIFDQDSYADKVGLLEALMAQKKIDFAQAKYIDLRFNEPILGENKT